MVLRSGGLTDTNKDMPDLTAPKSENLLYYSMRSPSILSPGDRRFLLGGLRLRIGASGLRNSRISMFLTRECDLLRCLVDVRVHTSGTLQAQILTEGLERPPEPNP
jgi:hypothetical protein